MKLGVFGSRSITDNRIFDILDKFLEERPTFDTIVTAQEPAGVCNVAQAYAQKNAMILELHFLNNQEYAAGMYEHRSENIIKASDFILLIHDGESHGTTNELEQTIKYGRKYLYEVIPPTSEKDIPISKKNKKQKAKSTYVENFDYEPDVILLG